MFYTLFNKKNKRYLNHPLIGLWFTDDETEANDMLSSCSKYMMVSGLDFLVEDICVISFEDEKEIN